MNCSGDMHGGIDGGVVDGGVHGGLGAGFGSGFGGSGGSVPHETDDIADILDVGLMKGLGECRCVTVVPFWSGMVCAISSWVRACHFLVRILRGP